MIVDSFKKAEEGKAIRPWKNLYILIDIHNTIVKATYFSEERFDFFDYALECLQLMSRLPDLNLILWTSTYEESLKKYLDIFKKNDIHFDFINENPDFPNNEMACYDHKPYFNVGIDDKFGFNPETEWKILYDYLLEKYQIKKL